MGAAPERVHRDTLARLRALCMALPETSERLSHGAPTFFIREKRSFVTYHDNHHGDGRLAIWAAAPAGMQPALVDAAPEVFFVPPYVGHLGWVGMRLDREATWEDVSSVAENAYATRAPRAVAEAAARLPPS
jgi:hypothetical protein